MTPKEKAKELYNKYIPLVQGGYLNETYHTKSKQCAIIAVDEILLNGGDFTGMSFDNEEMFIDRNYWEQVKQEVEKL